jgi:DNA-binding MltR family transcriptional regulator
MDEQITGSTREWKRLIEEFQKKSDRAVAILGTTYLNTHLARLLECFIIDDEKISKMLLSEENPLGSFEARIKAAYGLGLISKTEYHDLVLLWHIRNRFILAQQLMYRANEAFDEKRNLRDNFILVNIE